MEIVGLNKTFIRRIIYFRLHNNDESRYINSFRLDG